MPEFHVFYCRQRTGDEIASHRPAPIETDRIPSLAADVLEVNGDFFGLIDDEDAVLQFLYLARDAGDKRPIRMEIPDNRRKANLVRHISSVELTELLSRLPERLTMDVVQMGGIGRF